MPYSLPSRIHKEETEITGAGESQTSTSERDGDPETPPTTPEHTAYSPGSGQEEEPEDLIFATPPEGNRPSETTNDQLAEGEEDSNGNFLKPLDELAAPPDQPAPNECWDYPESIVPPMVAGQWEEGPVEERALAPEEPRADSGSEETLREKWQATHGMDPPAWADKGFAGIKGHMKQ